MSYEDEIQILQILDIFVTIRNINTKSQSNEVLIIDRLLVCEPHTFDSGNCVILASLLYELSIRSNQINLL